MISGGYREVNPPSINRLNLVNYEVENSKSLATNQLQIKKINFQNGFERIV